MQMMVGLAIDPISATASKLSLPATRQCADLGICFDTGSGPALATSNLGASLTYAPNTAQFCNLTATLRQKPPGVGLIRVCLMQSGGVYDSGNITWAVAGLAGIGGLSVMAKQ